MAASVESCIVIVFGILFEHILWTLTYISCYSGFVKILHGKGVSLLTVVLTAKGVMPCISIFHGVLFERPM